MGKVERLVQQLNKQATDIFMKECILISGNDGITKDKVIDLLGITSYNHVINRCKLEIEKVGTFYNMYTLDDTEHSIIYLTYKGFMCAVSYHNCLLELRGEQDDTNGRETY